MDTRRSFSKKVYAVVVKIPKRETLTYKQVAVRVDGAVGGYHRGSKNKALLLTREHAKIIG